MKPKSAKAKGRALQQLVAKAILEAFPQLTEADVASTAMGQSGMDVRLSTAARAAVPFAIECKAVERLSVFDAWKQAATNADIENLSPLLVIKRNRTAPLVVVDLQVFLGLLQTREAVDE